MQSLRRLPGLFALALVLALPAAPVNAAPIPADPFTITIPVLVLDHHGQPILQLDRDQFRLADNGRPQSITGFDRDPRPVSLAIVVDAGDRDAIAQLKRSAQLLVAMVMGDAGEASVFVSGPNPRQVLAFTHNQDQVVDALQHLEHAPVAPLGHGQVTEPANLALLDLANRPNTQVRAVLIVGKDAATSSAAASALRADAALHDITIFRLSPHRPDHTEAPTNPDTAAVAGNGQGSQRAPQIPAAADGRGTPAQAPTDQANVNLTPVAGAAASLAGALTAPHRGDYVYASGGLTLAGGDDAEFDRQLTAIGADLRGFYFLVFHPDDLAAANRRHQVGVSVQPAIGAAAPASLSYRRTYWVPAAR